MRRLAVLAQRFAVVSGQKHERPAVEAGPFEVFEKRFERRVGVGHFPVIKAAFEPGFIRLRRRVRLVGIPEMDP